MSGLPEPLTAPDCDCRGLSFMPLDVQRLRDSDLALLSTGDEFKAAVLLWCAAWHQTPAGSLPSDDRVLSRLSGLDAKAWKRAKAMALRGWAECSDGRLYHAVVAEKAAAAWGERIKYRQRREVDRDRLRDWRDRKLTKPIARNGPLNEPSNDPETPHETGSETRFETSKTGTGTYIPPVGTPSVAPPELGKEAWQRAVQLLTSAGRLSETKARTFFGKLLAEHRLDPADLLPSIVKAQTNGTADPQAYLARAAQMIASRRGGTSAPPPADVRNWTDAHWENVMRIWREENLWDLDTMGPEPGKPGCIVPARHLVGAVA